MSAILTCFNTGDKFVIDKEDFDMVSKYRWELVESGVYGDVDGKYMSLSRYILGVKDKSKRVLRRDRSCLDYRKSNLFSGNIYRDRGNYYDVECYDGRFFKISKDSIGSIIEYQWHIDKNKYVITKNKSGRVLKLHRLLMGVTDVGGVEVDHINRDTLDNRLDNLRLADRSLNCFNRDVTSKNKSGVIGVYKMSGYSKWCAQINKGGVRTYLGSYNSFDEAVSARKDAERNMYNI